MKQIKKRLKTSKQEAKAKDQQKALALPGLTGQARNQLAGPGLTGQAKGLTKLRPLSGPRSFARSEG